MGYCLWRFKQFFLLAWKNLLLQFRRPGSTILEVTVPLLFIIMLVILKNVLPNILKQEHCFVTLDSDPLTLSSPLPHQQGPITYKIYYAPMNDNTTKIMGIVASKLPVLDGVVRLMGYSTEEEMVDALKALPRPSDQPPSCFVGGAGVYFDNLNGSNLEYTLRLRHEVGGQNSWQTRLTIPAVTFPGPRITENLYLSEGFLHIQNLVGQAIIDWRAALEGVTPPDVDISVRQLPYPPYTSDLSTILASVFTGIIPLFLIISLQSSSLYLIKELLLEKELRLRETLLMMGVPHWMLWSSWYFKQFVFYFPTVIVMVILIKFGRLFPESDFFLILILMLLYLVASISFSFLISVWFNSTRVGMFISGILWFLSFLPFLFFTGAITSLEANVGACLLSSTCLGLGARGILLTEGSGNGITWSSISQPFSADSSFSLAHVLGMLLLDTVFYMVLAWYVNGVKPGTYGVPKPFYFPCLPSYWTGNPQSSCTKKSTPLVNEEDDQHDPSAHEEVINPPEVGISIRNLTKIYGLSIFGRLFSWKKKQQDKDGVRRRAVDNFSLDMYKGQITALLGHNGAGKTTTMSILTGLYTPTDGTATIGDCSILTDMDQIRKRLGFCPQHNTLYEQLTVKEHLTFFLRLRRGDTKSSIQEEAETMAKDLQLADKLNTPVTKLSGGMKRKLSVGIALVGGSEVVILDEPTTGMDPYARRATWDLLNKYKQNRTILLSTHSMDEADLLGDRIAIMVEGKLRCSGSSLFLKSRYGVGYHMTIVKEATCDSSQVESLIKSMVPQAEQVTDVGAELSFILPSTSTAQFPDLFDTLEARKEELGVSSFGVSITTMEEVFMKVGEGMDETLDTRYNTVVPQSSPTDSYEMKAQGHQRGEYTKDVSLTLNEELPEPMEEVNICDDTVTMIRSSQHSTNDLRASDELSYTFTPNSGITHWFQQFCAIFLKGVYNSVRSYIALISQLVLPILFILIGLILAKTTPSVIDDDPKRSIELRTSAVSTNNLTLFFAQFGDLPLDNSSNFTFAGLLPSDLGATDLLNLTDQVQSIIDRVQTNPPSDIQDCCQYSYQLLDGFCASRTAGELRNQCRSDVQFGYSKCDQCLSCCQATGTSSTVASCSSSYSLSTAARSSSDFCPTPPKTSATDSALSGPLESENVYVAEHLLNVSAELRPEIFFARYQAGFTITRRDPPISVCGCDSAPSQTEPQVCEFFSPLQPANATLECPNYSFNGNGCASAWLACLVNASHCGMVQNIPGCSQLEPPTNVTGNICNNTLPSCYAVDRSSSDVLKALACNSTYLGKGCSNQTSDNRTVGATYPSQAPQIAATVWYNNQPYHMPAAALNTFHTILLRKVLGNDAYKITVNNHPLPRTATAQLSAILTDFSGLIQSFIFMFGISFLLASFVISPVKEREIKAKLLQFVSGVFPSSYWLATFAWDLLNASVPVIVSIILFAAFQIESFSGEGLGAVFLLLVLTCWAGIPFVYFFSFAFKKGLTAYRILLLVFQIFGLIIFYAVFFVRFLVSILYSRILHYIFLLLPSYALPAGVLDIYTSQRIKAVCGGHSQCENTTLYVSSSFDVRYPGVGGTLLLMAILGGLLFSLTLLIEYKCFLPVCLRRSSRSKASRANTTELCEINPLLAEEDNDVSAERRRVSSGEADKCDVVINNLVKVFPVPRKEKKSIFQIAAVKRVVNGISVAIPGGECFGLLGLNGAGKTTVFNILTGDLPLTSGTASVAGYDIQTNLGDVRRHIGYCPQFDALLVCLTGRELLTMFARLRGVPEKQIKNVVDIEIARVDLKKYANKQCGSYSGGNKRKLSTAVALIGNPPIVLLDEPTTGMDPTTRRYIWDVLAKLTREGRSIILTSHSMEECEALCTRIAIMVNGSFKCLGSIQHLKNKFGAGFTLQAKVGLKSSSTEESEGNSPSRSSATADSDAYNTESLDAFITEEFPGAVLWEKHQGAVTYQLPSGAVSWSAVFRLLEENKERLGIVDYSVSQTTLEQVFITFAKQQKEEDQ